jgi:AraC-like DNA-binding protein
VPESSNEPHNIGDPLDDAHVKGHAVGYYRTSDPDEASDLLARAIAPNRLQIRGRREDFDFRLWNRSGSGIDVGYVSPGADISLTVPPRTHYALLVATAGTLRVRSNGQSHLVTGADAAVLRPDEPASFEEWSPECRVLSVRFKRDELEQLLSTMLGRHVPGTVQFELGMSLSTPGAKSMCRILDVLRIETEQPGVANGMMAEGLGRLLTMGLVLAQSHNHSDELHRPSRVVPPRAIRNAIELIEGTPEQVSTVADIARVAHLSVRALEQGFRTYFGVPPMTYLRDIRLTRVHEQLRRADPDQISAALVAQRWGFSHYGRFAMAYRKRYGVSPSVTLRAAACPTVLVGGGPR